MDLDACANILFVDDDRNLLDAITRQFHGKFVITTALGGTQGLRMLESSGPFAVIVSDMRMPDMNGIQFLSAARSHDPDAVRIMLTGNADLDTAMHAVNEGNIFRFLMKPCRKEVLEWALEAAVEQHRLVTAERELLEKTLKGGVQVLTDILSLVNPVAFSRASRLREYVSQMARHLNLDSSWQLELAALLSQIGCVAVPADILAGVYSNSMLSQDEEQIYHAHPGIGSKLVSQIPRLELVSRMIADQGKSWSDSGSLAEALASDKSVLGSHLLKICIDFDTLICQGKTRRQAIDAMKSRGKEYYPTLLNALECLEVADLGTEECEVAVRDLNDSMLLAQDVRTKAGLLVAPEGQRVTLSMRVLLENYTQRNQIEKRIRVLVSSGLAHARTSAHKVHA
jgi:response regulator RpfG family c-di-GMP phosphodiesterase